MSTPQITYNSRTLSFPEKIYDIQIDYPGSAIVATSVTNIVQVLNVAPDVFVKLAARLFENSNSTHATFKRNIYQWFEWARQGFAWQLAMDPSKTANTTISSGALTGASSVVVADATGLVVGDNCVLKSSTQQEVVNIASISSTTIGLTETLLYDYASGVRFRHEKYWPARLGEYNNASQLVMIRKHPVQEKPPLHFDTEFVFMEDMN